MNAPKFLVPTAVAIAVFGAMSLASAQSQIPPAKDPGAPTGSSQNQNQRTPSQMDPGTSGTKGAPRDSKSGAERPAGSPQPMTDPAPGTPRTGERPARADRN